MPGHSKIFTWHMKGKPEILYFGPDEGTAGMMDLGAKLACDRGYPYWNLLTTGKTSKCSTYQFLHRGPCFVHNRAAKFDLYPNNVANDGFDACRSTDAIKFERRRRLCLHSTIFRRRISRNSFRARSQGGRLPLHNGPKRSRTTVLDYIPSISDVPLQSVSKHVNCLIASKRAVQTTRAGIDNLRFAFAEDRVGFLLL